MSGETLLKGETDTIIGCAFEVLNTIGHGFHEKPYENALVIELGRRGIPYVQQPRYPIVYCGVQVSEFVPDLVVYGAVVVDAKVIERISDQEIGQMLNYLKITGCKVGLLLNFKNSRLEVRRVVASTTHFIRSKYP